MAETADLQLRLLDSREMANDQPSSDLALEQVRNWFHQFAEERGQDLSALFGAAIRRAIDDVLDGPTTGRWSLAELEKTEKAYIGTRVEILIRTALGLKRAAPLDLEISSHPVDIKFSVYSAWQIPIEAVGQLCLVVGTRRSLKTFSVGIVRCHESLLNPGRNNDKKRTLSKAGRDSIAWLIQGAPLPRNFIADLPAGLRERVMAHRTGQARIRELVTAWQEKPIPRDAVETVAQQKDPLRRLRRDRGNRLKGIRVLSSRYAEDRDLIKALGLPELRNDEFISVGADKIEALRRS